VSVSRRESGDSAELVGDTGLMVPRRDAAALAAAWEQITGMRLDERRALGRRARERILGDYDIDVIIRRYEMLYERFAA
jgi:glycosyltransferase involved in cell wall biosynthesis